MDKLTAEECVERFYKVRDVLRALSRDNYAKNVEEWCDLLKQLSVKLNLPPLQACIKLQADQVAQGKEPVPYLYAATLELMERKWDGTSTAHHRTDGGKRKEADSRSDRDRPEQSGRVSDHQGRKRSRKIVGS